MAMQVIGPDIFNQEGTKVEILSACAVIPVTAVYSAEESPQGCELRQNYLHSSDCSISVLLRLCSSRRA
jgi:hypothetical protein